MLSRLESLFPRLGIVVQPQDALAQLQHLYSIPPRAYHNLQHVEDCLGQFDGARHLMDAPDTVEMALIFHDGIYTFGKRDDELASADFAQEWLLRAGAGTRFATDVRTMILASKHTGTPADGDTSLFADIDLSILGRPWEEFLVYDKRIEQEYFPLYGERYWQGRKDVLGSFLARPRIYSTDFFHERYGKQAEENIKRRIAA